MNWSTPRSLLVLLLALAGCTETIRLDHDPLDNLVSVDVVPSAAMIELTDLSPPHHTLQYEAIGHFVDGSSRDITELVTWAIDRDVLGGFEDRGLFVASHAAAGYATVAARVRGLQATGGLQVRIDTTIVDTAFPPPAANLFDSSKPVATGDPTRSPSFAYPSNGTLMPELIVSTLFQLETGQSNDAFRITFDSELFHLAVETGADRWRADGEIQRLLAASAGPSGLQVGIQATSSASSLVIYEGPSIELAFSRDLTDTPLYFWSAATNGIMRGGVDLASPSKLYPSDGKCVGCHALNRAGTEMAVSVDDGGGLVSNLETVALATQEPTIAASPTRPAGWSAYSPDGSRLVVANNGILTQYNARTGASLGTIPLPSQRYATHPDWAPDGTSLAIAYTTQIPTNLDVRGASIAVLPFTNGVWGAPQILVTGSMTSNNYFPRWSPDGSVLAFVRASTSSRGAASAELMLVGATGSNVQTLAIANRRVGAGELTGLANTMPAWAPRIGSRTWLAFVSSRPYGKVVVNGPSQIWLTSIDLTQPGDTTTAAFWLPSQDVTVLNNNPVWSALVLSI